MYLTEWAHRVWIVSLSLKLFWAVVLCGHGRSAVCSVSTTEYRGECARSKGNIWTMQFRKAILWIQRSSCCPVRIFTWFFSLSCIQTWFQRAVLIPAVCMIWYLEKNSSLNSSSGVHSLPLLTKLMFVARWCSCIAPGDNWPDLFHRYIQWRVDISAHYGLLQKYPYQH